MKRFLFTAAVAFTTLIASAAMAAYPEDAITYQIPFGPGGQSDLEARRQQPMLEDILGQKVVIEYKPGGGGSLGWSELVRKKPDGYYISGINVPHIVLQPLARGNAGYTTEQIKPVAFFQATPIGLAVMKDSPIQSLEELVEFSKKNPGAMIIGGSGTWSGHHVAHLQLSKLAGANMTYIPSTGAAQSIADFLGGHVQAVWANSNDLVQHADKIRVLAFGSEEPFENMPEVPTFKSKGYELYASIDRGAGVPQGTPDEVVAVLEKAFLEIASNPEVIKQMREDGFVPLNIGAAEAQQYINEKVKQWAPIVEEFK